MFDEMFARTLIVDVFLWRFFKLSIDTLTPGTSRQAGDLLQDLVHTTPPLYGAPGRKFAAVTLQLVYAIQRI